MGPVIRSSKPRVFPLVLGLGLFCSMSSEAFMGFRAGAMNGHRRLSSGVCASGSQVFDYAAVDQAFGVPAACSSITVKAWGSGGYGSDNDCGGYHGGGGGYVSAVLAVTGGESLTVRVGIPWGGLATSAYEMGGAGGGSSSVLRGTTVLLEAGGGGGGGQFAAAAAGGGTRACATPGNQTGGNATGTPAGGGGGAGYCRGAGGFNAAPGEGGSSYVPAGGTEQAGSGTTPGNAGDPARGTAGNGGLGATCAGTTPPGLGRVIISWGP